MTSYLSLINYTNFLLTYILNLNVHRHAHPGNPYVFGLVEDDRDFDFPEPMPVVGMC